MYLKAVCSFLPILALGFFSTVARADTLDTFAFTLSGEATPSIQFTIPNELTFASGPGYPYFSPVVTVTLGMETVLSEAQFNADGTVLRLNSGDEDLDLGKSLFSAPGAISPGSYAASLISDDQHAGLPLGGPYPGTLVITQTPEPTSLLLLGTGLLGTVGVARRRFAA